MCVLGFRNESCSAGGPDDARVFFPACLACCGPRLSVLLEVRNCRLWPLPGTSSCRRPLRRKRSSDSSTVVCLTWIDAGSTSQSRYFLTFVAWLWFLQDKGFGEPTEQARAGWQCPSLKFEGRESFKLRPALRENLVLPLDLAGQVPTAC